MRVKSGHIIFKKGTEYIDLEPIYRDMYTKFLEETNQFPEEPEVTNMLIRENLLDIEENRKPEGYNRMGRMRMIFPIKEEENLEFYIYGPYKSSDGGRVTDSISKFLRKKGYEHDIEWDQMAIHKLKK